MTQESLERQLNRIRISLNDFQETTQFLRGIRCRQGDVVRRALLIAATIAYSRPFSNNERGNSMRATPRLQGKVVHLLTPAQLVVHETVLRVRNEAVAHSQWSRYPVKVVHSSTNGIMLKGRFFDILAERDLDLRRFREIARVMEEHCVREIFNVNRHLARAATPRD